MALASEALFEEVFGLPARPPGGEGGRTTPADREDSL
jgi:hypothetical protein